MKRLLLALLLSSCTTVPVIVPVPSPSPSPSPIVDMAATLIVDGWERPPYATRWVNTTARTILGGATTGFIIAPKDSCTCTFKQGEVAYKIGPIVTTTPSSDAVKAGTYYDALIPLNSTNCRTARYLWVDLQAGIHDLCGATATVTEKGKLPQWPSKPIYMAMVNSFLTIGHYGKYVNGSEALGVLYSRMLVDHRIQPYSNYVFTPSSASGALDLAGGGGNSYQSNVLNFTMGGMMWLPNKDDASWLQSANKVPNSWFYSWDEPGASEMSALKQRLSLQKENAPNVKRMVTTTFKTDLDADIFSPVADQFGVEGFLAEVAYSGKQLWLYVSCMSHGCGSNRDGNISAAPVAGKDSGAPDLTLDRTSAEPFGFMLIAHRYPSVQGLLYYNSVENYKLYAHGIDVCNDNFNFGGNGDGTLFYPGRPGIEGLTSNVPISSVRLKLLREAQNLSDLLSMVDITTEINAIMTDTLHWTRDVTVFENLQKAAIAKLP